MASHNLQTIKIDDLDIIGYSVGGEETVIAIPQLDVCFDIGKAPDQLISVNNVLLTHGHMDHSAGIAYYLSHRKFCGIKPGRVFAPENLVITMRELIDIWGRIDGTKIPAEFVPMAADDEVQIKPNLFVRAFATKHCRGSLGFSIIEKKRKLKEEFLGLDSAGIVELKRKHIEIDYSVETSLVTYLGDTRYNNFAKYDFIVNSKILIAECTFMVDEHIDRANAGDHMHIDEFAEMLEKLNNEHIIVTHLSSRTGIGAAKKSLKKKLSAELYAKTILLMDRANNTES